MILKSTEGIINIQSIQSEKDTVQEFCQTEKCTVYEKGDAVYVFYKESDDTLAGDVKSEIKIFPDYVNIVRKGSYRSNIIFKNDFTCRFRYYMPYGDADMCVKTDTVTTVITEEKISVKLIYTIDNGNGNTKTKMNITIEKVI